MFISYIKKFGRSFIPAILASFVVGGVVYAGTLTAPSGTPVATSYTLDDIYTRLTTGVIVSSGQHSLSTSTAPAASFRSLAQIYTAIPSLSAGDFLASSTYMGMTGTARPSARLTTGQIYCNKNSDAYASASRVSCAGTQQDGNLLRGVTRSYVDNLNETVTDLRTGLVWQKCNAGLSGSDCLTGAPNSFTLDDGDGVSPAINYCENLTLGGRSDWHLPNVNELQSLVDYGKNNPAIDDTYFPNTQNITWTSTVSTLNADSAWQVFFTSGYVDYTQMSDPVAVRCVHSL